MRVGIDIRTLMDKNYSGVSEYTLNLVKEILKQDASTGSAQGNEYILFYNSFRDVSDRIPKFEGNYKIVKTNYPNKVFNFLLQTIFKYPKLDILLGVDVFIAPNIGFYALSNGCQKILTIHDLSFLRYPEFFSWKRRLWHRIINIKKQIKKFDKIVTVSENTKQDVMELCGASEDKVSVVYPGLDKKFEQISNFQFPISKQISMTKFQSVRKKYGLPENYILFLGTVEPRKNIVGLIKAYNALRVMRYELCDTRLVIAGGFGWKYKEILAEYEKSKYKDDIIFLGYVDSEDKPALYQLAQMFVYPSFYEGFGFPPLEAMACGIPVITSFSSSLPEVVGDSAIMIDPYNIKDLTNAMIEVARNQNLRDNLVKKGFMQVEKFSWKKTGREYLNKILDSNI